MGPNSLNSFPPLIIQNFIVWKIILGVAKIRKVFVNIWNICLKSTNIYKREIILDIFANEFGIEFEITSKLTNLELFLNFL